MYKTIRYEKKDNIALVTIDRPEALNALNSTVIAELEQVVTELENDGTIRAMILTGEGRSFVAGADIGEQYPLDLDGGRRWGQRGSALFRRMERLEFPTIAVVNGFALGGGCELAMSCDIILASEKAKFGQPEVGLGITPGFSGTQRLPRLIGIPAALHILRIVQRKRKPQKGKGKQQKGAAKHTDHRHGKDCSNIIRNKNA